MLLLLVFALVAGAGTAITPCVLPVVPALLSASAVGGRRRPLGIVLGLAITFTIAIIALAQLVKGVGLASGATRDFAIVVLIVFGVMMLVPGLAQRVQAPLSRLGRFGPRTRGDGFWSGLGVGAALGFVCAPCAGPILSAVIVVSATTGPTLRVVLVAIAYVLGLSAVMLVYGFGGRAVLNRIRRAARGHVVDRVLGGVLLLTAVLMIFNLDVRFESKLGLDGSLPSWLTDPASSLENSHSVQDKLASLRPPSRFLKRSQTAPRVNDTSPAAAHIAIAGVTTPSLQNLGPAPEFTGTEDWFNTPGGKKLTLASMRGKVVIVDFWTYTCINCIRTLPYIEGLYKHYHRYGLDIVGVETPEFTFEQIASNVRQAIKTDGITYPVAQDNAYGTWDAYQNEYWPADYFIDAKGDVRHVMFGEGDYKKDEAVVRELLYDAGAHRLPAPMTAHAETASKDLGTPETYLSPRGSNAFTSAITIGTRRYSAPTTLPLDEFDLDGDWTIGKQSITPAGASARVSGDIQARDVYLVMTSNDNTPRRGRVLLNGKPIAADARGTDVGAGGYFTVKGERLYNLVKLKNDGHFTLTVQVPKGVSAYDFTFG
jgi:cytochrome c biogenesis protein CcdA/thiol-disulfide isomerase/thioredoxin